MTNEKRNNVLEFKRLNTKDPADRTRELVDDILEDDSKSEVDKFEVRIKALLKKDEQKFELVRPGLFELLNEYFENPEIAEDITLEILKDIELNAEDLFSPKKDLEFPRTNPDVVLEKSLVIKTDDINLLNLIQNARLSVDLKIRVVDYLNLWIEGNIISRFSIEEFGKTFDVGVGGIDFIIDEEKGTLTIKYKMYIDLVFDSGDTDEEDSNGEE